MTGFCPFHLCFRWDGPYPDVLFLPSCRCHSPYYKFGGPVNGPPFFYHTFFLLLFLLLDRCFYQISWPSHSTLQDFGGRVSHTFISLFLVYILFVLSWRHEHHSKVPIVPTDLRLGLVQIWGRVLIWARLLAASRDLIEHPFPLLWNVNPLLRPHAQEIFLFTQIRIKCVDSIAMSTDPWDTIKTSVKAADIASIRRRFFIPDNYRIILLSSEERMHNPSQNCIYVHIASLEADLWFPLAPEVETLLHHLGTSITQLISNSIWSRDLTASLWY